MLTSLQTVRRHLGYTAAQVIDLLTRRAHALNLPIATRVEPEDQAVALGERKRATQRDLPAVVPRDLRSHQR